MANGEISGRTSQLTTSVQAENGSDSSPHRDSSESGNLSAEWPVSRKWLTVTTACLVCFVVGINATAVLSATDEIAEEFHVDIEHFDNSFFLVTAWNTGAAIMPLFVLPLMEDFGIQAIYYGTYFIFILFVVAQAVAPNFATLIVARVIAGSCGGVLQNCVDGIAADVWSKDIHNRALSLTIYIFALLGGVTFGPVFGGLIIRTLNWRWIFYIQLIIYGAVVPYVILTLKDPRADMTSKSEKSRRERLLQGFSETILRAVRMLFTEFVVASFTLLSSFAFGTVFILTQSIPQVFGNLYGWSAWQTGVVQIAIFIGEAIGVLFCVFQDKIIYPRFAYPRGNPSDPVPEPRLYTVVPCSIFAFTAGFFIYAWTAYTSFSWILPSLGLFLIGIGIMVIVQAASVYVTDCYSTHASSAISGVAFGENIFAALLPLATRDMYNTLGFQWASGLLGFAGLLLSMAPVVLVFYGKTIRAKSKFADGP